MEVNKKTIRKKYVIHSKGEVKEAKWLIKEGVYKSIAEYKESMARLGELFEQDELKRKIKLKRAA